MCGCRARCRFHQEYLQIQSRQVFADAHTRFSDATLRGGVESGAAGRRPAHHGRTRRSEPRAVRFAADGCGRRRPESDELRALVVTVEAGRPAHRSRDAVREGARRAGASHRRSHAGAAEARRSVDATAAREQGQQHPGGAGIPGRGKPPQSVGGRPRARLPDRHLGRQDAGMAIALRASGPLRHQRRCDHHRP